MHINALSNTKAKLDAIVDDKQEHSLHVKKNTRKRLIKIFLFLIVIFNKTSILLTYSFNFISLCLIFLIKKKLIGKRVPKIKKKRFKILLNPSRGNQYLTNKIATYLACQIVNLLFLITSFNFFRV